MSELVILSNYWSISTPAVCSLILCSGWNHSASCPPLMWLYQLFRAKVAKCAGTNISAHPAIYNQSDCTTQTVFQVRITHRNDLLNKIIGIILLSYFHVKRAILGIDVMFSQQHLLKQLPQFFYRLLLLAAHETSGYFGGAHSSVSLQWTERMDELWRTPLSSATVPIEVSFETSNVSVSVWVARPVCVLQ